MNNMKVNQHQFEASYNKLLNFDNNKNWIEFKAGESAPKVIAKPSWGRRIWNKIRPGRENRPEKIAEKVAQFFQDNKEYMCPRHIPALLNLMVKFKKMKPETRAEFAALSTTIIKNDQENQKLVCEGWEGHRDASVIERNQLQDDRDRLQGQVGQRESQVKELQGQVVQLESQIEQQDEENGETINDLKDKAAQQKCEIDRLETQVKTLTSQVTQQSTNYDQLNEAKKELEKSLQNERNSKFDLQSKLGELREQNNIGTIYV